MTGTPQHSLHATVPRSAVWRVTCKLNPCTQALRMGDERFLSNVFKRFFIFITFFNVFYFFSERFLHLWLSKVLPYSCPNVGPGADPGVQAVSSQVTVYVISAVGCHYFPSGLQSPSQLKNVTVLRPLPSYTAW